MPPTQERTRARRGIPAPRATVASAALGVWYFSTIRAASTAMALNRIVLKL